MKKAPGRQGHHIRNLVDVMRDPMEFFSGLRERHGNVFRYDAGGAHVIVTLDPDMIHDVLVSKAKQFHKLPILKREQIIFGPNSVLLIEGEDHKRMRRLLQPAFHAKVVEGYGEIAYRRTSQWVQEREAGQECEIHESMMKLTEGIIAEALFGHSLKSNVEEISEAFMTLNRHFVILSLEGSKYWIKLPIPSMIETRQALRVVEEEIMRMVTSRRESESGESDLLSILLAAQAPEGTGQPLSNEEVHDQIATLFLAGHETTAAALTWSCYILAQHPEVQQAARDEVLKLGSDQPLTAHDAKQLPFLRAVISEALRLYPPIWNLGRHALEDMEVQGYEIKRGDYVLTLPYLVHRDERWWPDADHFHPERWLNDKDTNRPKYAFFPFGGGPRGCVGEGLAWVEITLVLATMLRQWSLSLPAGSPDTPELLLGVTLGPRHGIPLRLDPR